MSPPNAAPMGGELVGKVILTLVSLASQPGNDEIDTAGMSVLAAMALARRHPEYFHALCKQAVPDDHVTSDQLEAMDLIVKAHPIEMSG